MTDIVNTETPSIVDETGNVTPEGYKKLSVNFRRYAGVFRYMAEMCTAMADRAEGISNGDSTVALSDAERSRTKYNRSLTARHTHSHSHLSETPQTPSENGEGDSPPLTEG